MHGLLSGFNRVCDNSAAPILSAFQNCRGQIVDLEFNRTIGGTKLCEAAEAVARWLVDRGMSQGDRAVFSLGNGPAFTATFCGVLTAGGTPLVLHGDTPPAELRRVAHQYSARFVLSQQSFSNPAVTDNRQGSLPDWLQLECVELTLGPENSNYPAVAGASLHPTSGTTGQAKMAIRTAQQSFEEARHYIEAMEITAQDRILCVVPMSHAYGFGMGFMVSLLSGATLVTLRQFNPRTVRRALVEQQITIFPAVPAMLDLIIRLGVEGATMPRLVLAAGAPLLEATATTFRQRTGTAITPLYGTTETGGITVAIGEPAVMPSGCVGRPMRGVEACIESIADAAELPPRVGRVKIRSSSMMTGYLTSRGIDSRSVHDGWFETGDLGRIDDVGRIQLVGREKEIINVFGLKVVPNEVEEVIGALRGVREVKVYPGKHRSGSDLVQVAVAAVRGVDVDQIRAHCAANLPPFKRPQVIHLVDALPRTSTGKIIRDRLP